MRKVVIPLLVTLGAALFTALQWMFSEAFGHLLTDWIADTLAPITGLHEADVIGAIAPYVPPAAIAAATIYGAYRVGIWEREQKPVFELDYLGDESIHDGPPPGTKWHTIYVKNTKDKSLRHCQLRAESLKDKDGDEKIKLSLFVSSPFDLTPFEDATVFAIAMGADPALWVHSLYQASKDTWYPITHPLQQIKLLPDAAPYQILFRITADDCAPRDMRLRAWREGNRWRLAKI
jgi:hypothetical protein